MASAAKSGGDGRGIMRGRSTNTDFGGCGSFFFKNDRESYSIDIHKIACQPIVHSRGSSSLLYIVPAYTGPDDAAVCGAAERAIQYDAPEPGFGQRFHAIEWLDDLLGNRSASNQIRPGEES